MAEAHAVFDRAQRAFPGCMEGLDALVTPSAPGQAPAGLEWTGDPVFNLIWTSLHVPCVTVPAGTGPDIVEAIRAWRVNEPVGMSPDACCLVA